MIGADLFSFYPAVLRIVVPREYAAGPPKEASRKTHLARYALNSQSCEETLTCRREFALKVGDLRR